MAWLKYRREFSEQVRERIRERKGITPTYGSFSLGVGTPRPMNPKVLLNVLGGSKRRR